MILFIKHIEIEGPETLGTFFFDQGYGLAVVNLHDGDQLPDDPRGLDAVIPLGGPMNVYEEDQYPFLKAEDIFLKKVLAARIPVLGICLGAQLLSKASGGTVVRSPKPEIGWFDVEMTADGRLDPLLGGLPPVWEVFQWHGDMCQPPPQAKLLAASARCPVQAFRYGTNAYGLQFHAEITDKSIVEWSGEMSPQEQEKDGGKMLRHYQRVKTRFHAQGRQMCENFLRIIKG